MGETRKSDDRPWEEKRRAEDRPYEPVLSGMSPGEVTHLTDNAILDDFAKAMGVPAQEVETRLRGGKENERELAQDCDRGFNPSGIYLGSRESLAEAIKSPAGLLLELGLGYEAIFDPLQRIRDYFVFDRRLLSLVTHFYTTDDFIVTVSVFMSVNDPRVNYPYHSQNSPFRKLSLSGDLSNVDLTIVSEKTRKHFRAPCLVIGGCKGSCGFKPVRFFEGLGSGYKLIPEMVVQTLPGFTDRQKELADTLGLVRIKDFIQKSIDRNDARSVVQGVMDLEEYWRGEKPVYGGTDYWKSIVKQMKSKMPNAVRAIGYIEELWRIPELIKLMFQMTNDELSVYLKQLVPGEDEEFYSAERCLLLGAINRFKIQHPERKEELIRILEGVYKKTAQLPDSYKFCLSWLKGHLKHDNESLKGVRSTGLDELSVDVNKALAEICKL